MVILDPEFRHYSWGSYTALPAYCDMQSDARLPIAELWFGAHSSGSSRLPDGSSLRDRILASPLSELGPRVVERFGAELPFLVKLISAAHPLSLQAHPSLADASRGYREENEKMIDQASPARVYKDSNHKPELLVAISDFRVLAGFRPAGSTVRFLEDLNVPGLRWVQDRLASLPEPEGLRAVFDSFYGLLGRQASEMIEELAQACANYIAVNDAGSPWLKVASAALNLAQRYPNDRGVLVGLLLNHIELAPGEAIYLGPGQLHSYLDGLGLEVMGNSDNVVRGGLTDKYVDHIELGRIVSFAATPDPIIRPEGAKDGAPFSASFSIPVADFRVSSATLDMDMPSIDYNPEGPEVVVCTRGELEIEIDDLVSRARRGNAVWVPASAPRVRLAALAPSEVFRVCV